MPVVVWFITMCEDCILTPDDTDTAQAVRIGITVNTLIVLKFLLSPIIYTIRMKDFKVMAGGLYRIGSRLDWSLLFFFVDVVQLFPSFDRL